MPVGEFQRRFREAFHRDLTPAELLWYRWAELVTDDPPQAAGDVGRSHAA